MFLVATIEQFNLSACNDGSRVELKQSIVAYQNGRKLMITLARPILTTASLLALAMGTGAVQAAESCSAYPTGTAESIDSSDLASQLGPVPKPGKELRFAYVTKTLINEFWQDVAAGVKNEAAKYGIKVDVQAAKDELSMVEQLNLAQTVASQKPDALLRHRSQT